MRCLSCGVDDDKVVDSRSSDDGTAIRRRRQCLGCGSRFTTFERLEEVALVVVKRSGDRVSFDRAKVVEGVRSAAKGRPVSSEDLESLADEIEESMRLDGPEVSSERIGLAVLERLRDLDQVSYVRFASVYKGFDDLADFEREVGLLAKATDPKRHGGVGGSAPPLRRGPHVAPELPRRGDPRSAGVNSNRLADEEL